MNTEYREAVLAGPECDYPKIHALGDCTWCDAYYERKQAEADGRWPEIPQGKW